MAELGERGSLKRGPLMHDDLECSGQRAFNGGAADFGIALRCMRIADREKRPGDSHRIVHGRSLANAPVVDVAPEVAGWDRVDVIGLLWSYANDTEMRPDGDADVLEDPVCLLDRAAVDRHARVIDGLVDHPGWIGLGRPLEVVDCLGPVPLSR